mmetsp:Transcript_7601/g.8285  ORF Transcript_7601/g.8285 Transcript_7601/m.8285 type:complete len:84 (+) Transcript_7601:1034-1285(+)
MKRHENSKVRKGKASQKQSESNRAKTLQASNEEVLRHRHECGKRAYYSDEAMNQKEERVRRKNEANSKEFEKSPHFSNTELPK